MHILVVVKTFSDGTILGKNIEGRDENVQALSSKQSKAPLNNLRPFLATDDAEDGIFQTLHILDVAIDNIRSNNLIQKRK